MIVIHSDQNETLTTARDALTRARQNDSDGALQIAQAAALVSIATSLHQIAGRHVAIKAETS